LRVVFGIKLDVVGTTERGGGQKYIFSGIS